MPALFEIKSDGGSYTVAIERGALAARGHELRAGLVIADEYFAQALRALDIPAICLPGTETTKSLDEIGGVIVQMRQLGATRGTHLWAIGGGAIQDAACFIASIYMRGIDWTYLPTTLLGMVDSCIGGKSSINVGQYKNIVGTYHAPRTVLIDPALIETLPAEQQVAGLIEAAKICFCRGPDIFSAYLSHDPSHGRPPAAFEPVIALSLGAKKWFIEIDEFDRAERLLLNLGHTFGHALEGASGYRLSHGVAVGVGILCAQALSTALLGSAPGGSTADFGQHVRGLLAQVPDLPKILRDINAPATLDRIKADKKHETAHYRFVTFDSGGAVQLIRLPRTEATDTAVTAALRETLESLI
jgi:3-dehydroquinate synthase